jgi:hypothetical protein
MYGSATQKVLSTKKEKKKIFAPWSSQARAMALTLFPLIHLDRHFLSPLWEIN